MRRESGEGNCGQDLLYERRFYFQLKINGCSPRKSRLNRARRETEQVSQWPKTERVKSAQSVRHLANLSTAQRIVSERKNCWGREVITEEIQIFPRTEELSGNQSPQHNGQRPARHVAVTVPNVRRRKEILQGSVARMQQESRR